MDQNKAEVIDQILKMEMKMFKQVKTDQEPACRAHLDHFLLHRRAQFSVWSFETCVSYADDLAQAQQKNINLLTIKYARMDDLIPRYSSNPTIELIVDQFVQWQYHVMITYPMVMQGSRTLLDFKRYLEAELETYSEQTVTRLWEDVEHCKQNNVNMTVSLYTFLAETVGFSSLDAMERSLCSK